jgi:transposase
MNVLVEQLDERQRRLYAATEAAKRGWGGIREVREITGISYTAIQRGRAELKAGKTLLPEGRVRAAGGGRKLIEESQPGIREALQELVAGQTAGDPEGGGRWVRASLQHLKAELAKLGFSVSHQTVSRLLRDMGYRLRVNAKEKTGPSHPDRDKQFGHIQEQVADFQETGDPVISVDTKKRNSSATSRTPAAPGDARPMR